MINQHTYFHHSLKDNCGGLSVKKKKKKKRLPGELFSLLFQSLKSTEGKKLKQTWPESAGTAKMQSQCEKLMK